MTEERYYRKIVCGDEGLYDKNGGCIIVDIRSNLNLDENWDTIICLLNEQQATIEEQNKEIEESKITIQLYETDVSMRDNFLKSKGLYDEFLQCIGTVNE